MPRYCPSCEDPLTTNPPIADESKPAQKARIAQPPADEEPEDEAAEEPENKKGKK